MPVIERFFEIFASIVYRKEEPSKQANEDKNNPPLLRSSTAIMLGTFLTDDQYNEKYNEAVEKFKQAQKDILEKIVSLEFEEPGELKEEASNVTNDDTPQRIPHSHS